MNGENQLHGTAAQTKLINPLDQYIEEIDILGYTIVENVLSSEELIDARKKIDEVYEKQVKEAGESFLKSCQELSQARALLAYDDFFVKIAANKTVLQIVERVIGTDFILNQQNAIINNPNEKHHQSFWHRDYHYQKHIIDRPLVLSTLFCIDDFSIETGGTIVVPYTHRLDVMPSNEYLEKHQITVQAKAGSVLIFNSMLFHKAGYNSSENIRRAINQLFTPLIFKQMIHLPSFLGDKYKNDPFLRRLLGYESDIPKSVMEWRTRRYQKLNQKGNQN